MLGILKLAYKLLVNDKAKFTALLVGITFAVFLMIADDSHVRRGSQSRVRDGHQSGRIDVDHGPGRSNRREHDRHAGLRAGRGPEHAGRELCGARSIPEARW